MLTLPESNQDVVEILAKLGLRTFPLPAGSKAADLEDFPNRARVNYPIDLAHSNLAVSTGQGIVVLDFDVKPDKGIDARPILAAWDSMGLPRTLRTETPSGGIHVYLKTPPDMIVANRVGFPHPGVDIRGHHGYVVGPGSTLAGKPYRIIETPDGAIADAPDFILQHLTAPRERKPNADIPATEPDQPHIVRRAIDYLIQHAPVAVETWRGDLTTLKVFYRLRDFGLTQATALDLMLTYWNESKAVPPWHPDELAIKAANAFAYAKEQWGGLDATAEFQALPDNLAREIMQGAQGAPSGQPATSAAPSLPFRPWQPIDFATIPTRKPIYGNHYIRGFMSTTVAPGGLGKSALVLAECIAMCAHTPVLGPYLHGHAPKRVVYYNAEDPIDEIQRRVAAICLHHNIDQSLIADRLFTASGRDHWKDLLLAAGEAGTLNEALFLEMERFGRANAIDVFVFDPLANMTTSPETNEVFRAIGRRLSQMADKVGCAVELVHHTRKLGGNEATVEDGRGGSALLAAARAGRVLNRMTKDEAAKAGLSTHVDHFRIEADGKNNLMRSAEKADWYVRESVRLPQGDAVVAVAPWSWPEAMDGVAGEDVSAVVDMVREREGEGVPYRADSRSAGWVGKAVAAVMGLDLDDDAGRARAKHVIKAMLATGVIVKTLHDDKRQGRSIEVIIAGEVL
jgi:hypothetical protein